MAGMKFYFIALLFPILATLSHAQPWENLRPSASEEVQAQSVREMLERLLGQDRAGLFNVTIKSDFIGQGRLDKVEVVTVASDSVVQVHVKANTGVSASWGINHYVKYYGNSHISWDVIRIDLSSPLPEANFTLNANDHFRYYQNVCTPGYTFAFWQWPQWQTHLDWMALNGINLPLAFTAQEAIWVRVYSKLGVSSSALDAHFAGPAFLPWGRMGNLNGMGGPLPQHWHNFTLGLQHQILGRMRGFGMIPVLPAFAGHIPEGLTKVYPNISYTRPDKWNGFNKTFLLDPEDPMFQTIGTSFIEEYSKEFGTDHVYNSDTFNEMQPKTNDPGYLSKIGRAVFDGMARFDPKAVWIMQGWLFLHDDFWRPPQIRALLTSVPRGSMIILDLDSTLREVYTRTESFYGQPFIFNDLFNFGGNVGIFGRMHTINNRVFQARNMENSTMIGTGFTPEGLADNYAPAELMSEMSWRKQPVADLDDWLAGYARRRYGQDLSLTRSAWSSLLPHVLNQTTGSWPVADDPLIRIPNLNHAPGIRYPVGDVTRAWDYLVGAARKLGHEEGFRYDLLDVTREYLSNLAFVYYEKASFGFQHNQTQMLETNSRRYMELLSDLDRCLATDSRFLLGVWIEMAKSIGVTDQERALYEYNARNQITLWGPDGQILDYGSKQWSGLISHYYAPRWQLFFDTLSRNLAESKRFDFLAFREAFLAEIGRPFCVARNAFPTRPVGDTVDVVGDIYMKWRRPVLDNDV